MTAISNAFGIDRVMLQAGIVTPIVAPRVFKSVVIANGTAGDVNVYSQNGGTDDSSHYLAIATGYERLFTLDLHAYALGQPTIWLESDAGGLVILIWA